MKARILYWASVALFVAAASLAIWNGFTPVSAVTLSIGAALIAVLTYRKAWKA